MAKTAITTNDLKKFFAAYGITRPIDLSKAEDPGWQLRESVEEAASHLLQTPAQNMGDNYIGLHELKRVPGTSARIFNAMARFDNEKDLSLFDLAVGLEEANLLRFPMGKNAAALWHEAGSVRWDLVKHDRQIALAEYLDTRRNDDGRRSALEILEAWAQKDPANFEGIIGIDLRIREILLGSKNPDIRHRFLSLLRTPLEAVGSDVLEGFEELERDFEPLLSQLKVQDLATAQTLLKSADPQRVAVGLLYAKKLLNQNQFKALCRTLSAERPALSDKTVFSYGAETPVPATVGALLQTLVQGRSDLPTTLANLNL